MVEHEHGHIRGNAQLACLEYHISVPQLAVQAQLGRIGGESLHTACLVLYPIQIVQAPERVCQALPEFNIYIIQKHGGANLSLHQV